MNKKKYLSLGAASMLALAMFTTPAYAATVTGDHDGLSPENIQCKTGSLTLQVPQPEENTHKGFHSMYPQQAGYKFTLNRVKNPDLLQKHSWEQLDNLNPSTITDSHELEKIGTKKTPANGRLSFNDLPVGLYLVHGELPQSAPARLTLSDFLVTIPVGQDNNFWQCDPILNVKVALNPAPDPTPNPLPEPESGPVPNPRPVPESETTQSETLNPFKILAKTGVSVRNLGIGAGLLFILGGVALARSRAKKGTIEQ